MGFLVYARKKQRIKQSEIAECLGVTQATVSRIESLKHQPTLNQIFAIAKKLNLKIGIYFEGVNDGRSL